MYLEKFEFPDTDAEWLFFMKMRANVYDSFYPFQVLSRHSFQQIDFAPLTILYGGNGSGKSTALNIIAEKISAQRDAVFNHTTFYQDYLDLCQVGLAEDNLAPEETAILTSDDVFDYMLNIRHLNEGVDVKREDLFQEYFEAKYADFQFNGFEDYEELKKINQARSRTQSKFVKGRLAGNVRTYSNGESAYRFFMEKIKRHGLYLLDEPENSLSPAMQRQLAEWLEGAVRFDDCQLVIATHSPFLLAMKGAKIYDLDHDPVTVAPWTQLENVQSYRAFFKEHEEEF